MDISAQQPQHSPVRLLIAERSENAAHQFDSLLRDAGIATRLEIVDLPMAVDKLPHADMMICNAALPDLHQLLPRLTSTAPRVPIIVVNNDEGALTQSEGMELGAADVVSDTESRHLVLVVKRELENVCQNIQLKQTRRALNEAEQRCQLLLQSSRAAIAYVHEGMHIYANEGYLNLFGFEDADDLLGLPLIDLLDAESSGELKGQLKQFRNDEKETDFDFIGNSSDGTSVSGNMTLAAAEYEGEHCVQVTVRVDSIPSDAVENADTNVTQIDESAEQEADDNQPVPVLDAIVEGDVDGADAEADETNSNGSDAAIEFELELEDDAAESTTSDTVETEQPDETLEDSDSDKKNGTSSEALQTASETVPETISESVSESETSEIERSETERSEAEDSETPTLETDPDDAVELAETSVSDDSEVEAPRSGPARGLGEFLNQSEAIATGSEGQFVSIFAAQIDGYEEMQRGFGLAGVEGACRSVEERLLSKVDGPFMQISPYQWAMLVCDKTRDDALNKVEKYRAAIEAMMFEVREKTVRPSCTFGGAILNMEGFDSVGTALEATLNNAFTTLRSLLESSEGNTIELPNFDNAEQEFGDEANRILSLISEAIEKQSFILLFQPIISLRGDSDEHYEVFLRMNDRDGKVMVPGDFLRTAIDNGVAGKIDRWVILQSIKMLSAHRANGHNTRLTINLTCNSVADPEFIQWLGVAIKAARLPSDAVIFQITEQDASVYIRQTREFVEGLKNLHCRSSLSRFGIQPEPFELLSHIPVDFVKLDGSLVDTLDRDAGRKEQVEEMVRELQNAGKLTIVPMVESANLLSTLWQAGVNYIQGHYLQEPSSSMDYDFSTDD